MSWRVTLHCSRAEAEALPDSEELFPFADAPPVIDSNLLSERIDLDRMREGVRRALELLDHRSFQGVIEHVAIDPSGRGTGELSDDAAIDEWLLETVGDAAHICGTCH